MNYFLNEAEKSLLLWLPKENAADSKNLRALYRCHVHLDKLLCGEISLQDYCDVLSSEGVLMDDYINTAILNIEGTGMV